MLLKVYDKTHKLIGYIRKIRDLCIESSVDDGSETLSFTYLAQYHSLDTEYYVETADGEYVIKELSESSDGFPEFVAVQNREELWAKDYKSFSVKNSTIYDAARLACAGTGWIVHVPEEDDPEYIGKVRNAGMLDVNNADDVLQKLCTAFMVEIRYDSKNKQIFFYEKRGEDRGVYFKDGLNLKKLTHKRDTYDLYTRIRPVGKDNLSIAKVNDGVEYLENKTYSTKNRTYVWDTGDDYTDPQALMDDAKLVLADLAAPVDSFEADLIDLANQSSVYSVLSYQLGDWIKLIDSRTGTSVVRRIVKLTRYPDKPTKNTAEISSPILKFSDLSEKYKAAYDIINTVVSGDGRYTGTINVSDILHFEDGISGSSTISGINEKLEQATLEIGTVKANYISAEQADLKYATIENLNVVNEKVVSIDGDYAKFKSTVTDELAAHTGQIDDLQVAKGWMLEGSIGDAQIANVSANKLLAGTIDTGIINILGTDGRLSIKDNTITIKDDARIRVQIGKDGSGDYTLALWDSKGNLIWDALGVTENGIQRPIIRDDMVSENAGIQGSKLDIASVVTSINGGTTSLSTTIIRSGNKTLDVILQEQTQQISDYEEILTTYDARISATETGLSSKVESSEFSSFQDGMYYRLDNLESSITQTSDSVDILISDSSIEKFNEFLSTAAPTIVRTISKANMYCTMTLLRNAAVDTRYTIIADVETMQDGDTLALYQDDSSVSSNKLCELKYSVSTGTWFGVFTPIAATKTLILVVKSSLSSVFQFNRVTVKQGDVYAKTEIGDQISANTKLVQSQITANLGEIKSSLTDVRTDLDTLETWKTETSQTLTRDGIVSIVGSYYATSGDISASEGTLNGKIDEANKRIETVAEQTNDKFSWIIKSGEDISSFTLTDEFSKLVTDKFTVTDGLGQTVIEGGKVDLDKLFANDITATGTIKGLKVEGASGEFGALLSTGRITRIYAYDTLFYMGTESDYKGGKYGTAFWGLLPSDYQITDDNLMLKKLKNSAINYISFNQTYSESSSKMIPDRIEIGSKGITFNTSSLHSTSGGIRFAASYYGDTGISIYKSGDVFFTVSENGLRFEGGNDCVFTVNDPYGSLDGTCMLKGRRIYAGIDSVYNGTTGVYNLDITKDALFIGSIDRNSKIQMSNNTVAISGGVATLTLNVSNVALTTEASSYSGYTFNIGMNVACTHNITCKNLSQTSDRRLKDHIAYMTDNQEEYVQQLQQFRPAVYRFKDDPTRRYGLYAQDVRDSILESGTDPYGIVVANCTDGTTGDMTVTPDKCTYAMDYTEVIPLLINGFQVHHSKIAALEERISTLELLLQAAQEQLSTLQTASV